MQVSDFERSPIGTLVPITGHDAARREDYKDWAYVPKSLPSTVDLSMKTQKAVSEASLALGRLDFAVRRLPKPSLLVRPALRREAQSTSALEGTYATLQEVLEGDFIERSNLRAEVREVLNYVAAAERGLRLIEEKPICLTMLAELQHILVKGTPGENFDAGQLRTSQVYIGERHSGIGAARFVPTPPGDALIAGVSEWEKWINAIDDIPLLVKAALGHYQFETLHPFSDGNGRLGRLVVSLQLITADALVYPVLNISPWLEQRKDEYKDHLLKVSQTGDFDPWVRFFCDAVQGQAKDGVERIEELLAFRDATMLMLRGARVRGVTLEIADSLLGYPIISVTEATRLHGVTYPAANAAIARLVELGVLQEITGAKYGRIFACQPVMDILRRQ